MEWEWMLTPDPSNLQCSFILRNGKCCNRKATHVPPNYSTDEWLGCASCSSHAHAIHVRQEIAFQANDQ